MLENLPCQPITPIPDLAPNEEGIRPCLRCGKPVRIVQAYEKKAWNNGTCQETGQKWKYFDTDSQGGRGYKSGECVIWVSYPGID